MCGRYRLKDTDVLTEHLRWILSLPDWVKDQLKPRYNIAPWQITPTVIMDDEGEILPVQMRWGYVPFWDTSDKPKLAPINARAEEAFVKGMFKHSIQKRRCLIPADGFYEWQKREGRAKLPFDISMKDDSPFFFAGIYEKKTEARPDSFLLFTTTPNELMATIHDRMPAILTGEKAKQWIEPGEITPERFASFTESYPAEKMKARPISSLVNSVRNDGPECIAGPDEEEPPSAAPNRKKVSRADLTDGTGELPLF